eukprot:c20068_g1_i3.p1 GENE.c20068_g1_i3~~c20068_g1_i3.p1  ORF type:complete len:240 (+),score=50.57 c20068_g1_i3:25-744(+)
MSHEKLASDFLPDWRELVGVSHKPVIASTNYDEEAKKLFRQLNLGEDGNANSATSLPREDTPSAYRNLDLVWCHPTSQGKVYCGNLTAARSLPILTSHGITHILNCQERDSQNFHEEDPTFTYKRMPVATWFSSEQRQVAAKFLEHLAFVTEAVEHGHNVLIHCFAGAHRAGTATVAFLMLTCRWPSDVALQAARLCRPVIDPYGMLMHLLKIFEQHLTSTGHITWPPEERKTEPIIPE